ncbi:MAG: hypothetical protein AAFX94_04265 [Myxococcota bacterium]
MQEVTLLLVTLTVASCERIPVTLEGPENPVFRQSLSVELSTMLASIGAGLCESESPRARVRVQRRGARFQVEVSNADTDRVLVRTVESSSLPRSAEAFALSTLIVETLRGSWFAEPRFGPPPIGVVVDAVSGSMARTTPSKPRPSPGAGQVRVLTDVRRLDGTLLTLSIGTTLPVSKRFDVSFALGFTFRPGGTLESTSGETRLTGLLGETGAGYRVVEWGSFQFVGTTSLTVERFQFQPRATNDSPPNTSALYVAALAGPELRWHSGDFLTTLSAELGYPIRSVEVFDLDEPLVTLDDAFGRLRIGVGMAF